MPVPRLPAPRATGGRYRVLCGSNVYRHCTQKNTFSWFRVMCLTHFDLKIFKAALFFLKICHVDPHDCVQYFPSSSLPKKPSQKARHAYFCRADRLTFGRYESDPLPDLELQCSKLLESEDPDEELWAVHVPPKAPGAISWNISWDENRWKMDRKWFVIAWGLGCLCFFFGFDCGTVFRSKKFHVPRHEVQTLQDSEPELQSYSVTDFGWFDSLFRYPPGN